MCFASSMDKMLGCPSYLDSAVLADLRELLRSGIGNSEMLVILLTKGLLTRSVRMTSNSPT